MKVEWKFEKLPDNYLRTHFEKVPDAVAVQLGYESGAGQFDMFGGSGGTATMARPAPQKQKSLLVEWISAGTSRYGTPKWQSTRTGRILYQEERPGDDEHRGASHAEPEHVEPAASVTPKEPWEMTREEYARKQVPAGSDKTSPEWQTEVRARAQARDEHRESVRNVLREGKPVPPEVLADYPDLSPPKSDAQPSETPQQTFAKLDADHQRFTSMLNQMPDGTKFKIDTSAGFGGTWKKVTVAGDPFWLGSKLGSYKASGEFAPYMRTVLDSLGYPVPSMLEGDIPWDELKPIEAKPAKVDHTQSTENAGREMERETQARGEPSSPDNAGQLTEWDEQWDTPKESDDGEPAEAGTGPGDLPVADGGGANSRVARGNDGGSGNRPDGPRIVTVRSDITKAGNPALVPEALRPHLNEAQQHGVSLAIEAMETHGGFLCADGCVAAGTRIYNPITGEHVPIEVLVARGQPHVVLSLTESGLVPRWATTPFHKGTADLYRVTLDDGRKVTVTDQHRFFTPSGWTSIADGLCEGHFLACAEGHPSYGLGFSPSVHAADAPSWLGTPEDCLESCSAYHRPDGGPLLQATSTCQELAPSQGDALGRNRLSSHTDGLETSPECSRHHRDYGHLSRSNLTALANHAPSLTGCQRLVAPSRRPACLPQADRQSAGLSEVHLSVVAELHDQGAFFGSHCHDELGLAGFPGTPLHGKGLSQTGEPTASSCVPAGSHRQWHGEGVLESASCDFPCNCSSGWRRIASIVFVKNDDFFDMYVPGAESYVAEGIVHHNTGLGKTRQILAVAQHFAAAGKKVLVVSPAEVIKPNWKKTTMAGSFANDSAAMGVTAKLIKGDEPMQAGSIHVTTYNELAKVKDQVGKDTIVVFDESHYLKNRTSARYKHAKELMDKSGPVLYATATPGDKPLHIAHLAKANVFGNAGQKETYQKLGMRLVDQRTHGGGSVKCWQIDPHVGYREATRRLAGLFDQMTKDGLMIKRELSMDRVNVGLDRVSLSPEQHKDIKRVFDAKMRETSGNKAVSLMAARMHQEPFKIPHTVSAVQEELAAGRMPVVFVGRVNDIGDEDEDGEMTVESEGTAKALKAALIAAGVPENQIGELHGGATKTADQKKKSMEDFQSGKKRVMIATIQSGGTGINLDDTVGTNPRSLIMVTPPFTANDMAQALGRVNRLNTKSDVRVRGILADTEIDNWNAGLLERKFHTLGAVVRGNATRGLEAIGGAANDVGDEDSEPFDWGESLHHVAKSPSEWQFPFGKHKGRTLKDIPGDYLKWSLENMDALRPEQKQTIRDHLAAAKPVAPPVPILAPKPVAQVTATPAAPQPSTEPHITEEQREAIHQALRMLAGNDTDRARERNDVGFNQMDSDFGAKLAAVGKLTDRQASAAAKMLRKYHRQIPGDLHKTATTFTEAPPPPPPPPAPVVKASAPPAAAPSPAITETEPPTHYFISGNTFPHKEAIKDAAKRAGKGDAKFKGPEKGGPGWVVPAEVHEHVKHLKGLQFKRATHREYHLASDVDGDRGVVVAGKQRWKFERLPDDYLVARRRLGFERLSNEEAVTYQLAYKSAPGQHNLWGGQTSHQPHLQEWIRYEGPLGGHGWKSTKTDRVLYQDEMPGSNKHNGASDPEPVHHPVVEEQPEPVDVPDPLAAESPRDAASELFQKNDAEYAFARESAIPNAGEDILGSARHTRNAWRGLAEAEADGSAEELVTRENLMKAEPPALSDSVESNPLTALTMHLALAKYPAKPIADDNVKRLRDHPNLLVIARKWYYDGYRHAKETAEHLARTEMNPKLALETFHLAIKSRLDRLTAGTDEEFKLPQQHEGELSLGNARLFRIAARNEYIRFVNSNAIHPRICGKTGTIMQSEDFANRVRTSYGDTKDATRDNFDKIKQHVLDVIEGDSFNKTFGTVKNKEGELNAADLYVKHAERIGGPKVEANGAVQYMEGPLGMYGVQWGNSVTDDERRHHALRAAEAFADLADILGLPESLMSFNGEMGLAIGARGKGTAMAHFESVVFDEAGEPLINKKTGKPVRVINLTRKNGVGSLAHEWGHAFDYILAGGGDKYFSAIAHGQPKMVREGGEWKRVTQEMTPMATAFTQWKEAVRTSGFRRRLNDELYRWAQENGMSKKKVEYWRTDTEIFARTFERHIQKKLASEGRCNTYLSGIGNGGNRAWKPGTPGLEFWPNDAEVDAMAPAFDAIFKAAVSAVPAAPPAAADRQSAPKPQPSTAPTIPTVLTVDGLLSTVTALKDRLRTDHTLTKAGIAAALKPFEKMNQQELYESVKRIGLRVKPTNRAKALSMIVNYVVSAQAGIERADA